MSSQAGVNVQDVLYGATPKRLGFGSPSTGRWGKRYLDPLPDGTRHWALPDGEVVNPRFDYDRSLFVGEQDGAEWTAPWSEALTYHIASQIPGWCEPEQGRKLYELAAEGASLGGVLVEVGSFKGLSSTWIGWGGRSAGEQPQVYCLDTFTGGAAGRWNVDVVDEFAANAAYAGLRDTCIPVQGVFKHTLASWPAERRVSFLYIDGEHSYAQARADFNGWVKHCVPGALIAFDDCIADYPGVLRLQQELADDPSLELLGRTDAMVYWRLR